MLLFNCDIFGSKSNINEVCKGTRAREQERCENTFPPRNPKAGVQMSFRRRRRSLFRRRASSHPTLRFEVPVLGLKGSSSARLVRDYSRLGPPRQGILSLRTRLRVLSPFFRRNGFQGHQGREEDPLRQEAR